MRIDHKDTDRNFNRTFSLQASNKTSENQRFLQASDKITGDIGQQVVHILNKDAAI